MRRLSIFSTALLVGALGSSSCAQAQKNPDQRGWILQKMEEFAKVEPDPVPAKKLAAALSKVDIDGDRIADYAVNWGKVGRPGWCGTGGCQYQLWLGSASGNPKLVFDRRQRSVKTRKVKGEIVFDFDFHGSACGTFGAQSCPASFTWDAKTGRMVERTTAAGDSTIRFLNPVPLASTSVPSQVRLVASNRKLSCSSDGGAGVEDSDNGEGVPISIPDVDGDGIRDWAFHMENCAFDDDQSEISLGDALVISNGNASGGKVVEFNGPIAISVSTVPATVYRIEKNGDCSMSYTQPGEKQCLRKVLRWDSEAKSFRDR